jgi:4-aminobutyrate aminotransferase / (S)-3-amino-2-methylpropionate transaminase / 5-aminovalerate transaminase
VTVEQKRLLATAIPGPRSIELHARKNAAVSSGVSTMLPVYVERAGGGIVVDVDGNQLIDFGSGIAVASVGNAAPRVVENVQAQVADFTHTCFMVTPYEGYVAVAEKLNELTPGSHEKRSALFNSGAEAVENAVKIARSATGRPAIVAFDHAYHGRTNMTMALTAKNMPYKHRFGPFANEVYRVPMAYPYRWPTGPDNCADEAFAEFTSLVHAQIGEDNCAAVIIEPIQGEGGFIVPAPGYLARVAQWCADHGILFIADEIQTGFGRTGKLFACEHYGLVPDLITTAKSLAGGLPLAAVTGRADVMEAPQIGGLGGTYGGNPLACAAALAVLDAMEAERIPARAQRTGDRVKARFRQWAEQFSCIGDIRGLGAMVGMELVTDRGSRTPDKALAGRLVSAALERGLVLLSAGTFGNTIRVLAPLTAEDAVIDEGLDVMGAALEAAVGRAPALA